jgi:uncharacterized membrane protein YbhN (UPF0104 family)
MPEGYSTTFSIVGAAMVIVFSVFDISDTDDIKYQGFGTIISFFQDYEWWQIILGIAATFLWLPIAMMIINNESGKRG